MVSPCGEPAGLLGRDAALGNPDRPLSDLEQACGGFTELHGVVKEAV